MRHKAKAMGLKGTHPQKLMNKCLRCSHRFKVFGGGGQRLGAPASASVPTVPASATAPTNASQLLSDGALREDPYEVIELSDSDEDRPIEQVNVAGIKAMQSEEEHTDEWVCLTCTFLHRSPTTLVCDMCGTSRDQSPEASLGCTSTHVLGKEKAGSQTNESGDPSGRGAEASINDEGGNNRLLDAPAEPRDNPVPSPVQHGPDSSADTAEHRQMPDITETKFNNERIITEGEFKGKKLIDLDDLLDF